MKQREAIGMWGLGVAVLLSLGAFAYANHQENIKMNEANGTWSNGSIVLKVDKKKATFTEYGKEVTVNVDQDKHQLSYHAPSDSFEYAVPSDFAQVVDYRINDGIIILDPEGDNTQVLVKEK